MAMGKYGHLIKPLQIGSVNREDGRGLPSAGPGSADRMIHLHGRDHLEGMHLDFTWGVHTKTGDWHADMAPHSHPFPECLIFVGLDTANVKYLGAEISCCLGPEQETYTFNEPTLVILPPGLPHGPITTKRVYSPRGFGCWSVELSSEPEITSNKPAEATGKYAHLVKSLKSFVLIERGKINSAGLPPDQSAQHEEKLRAGEKPGPGNADHLVWISGKELEGLNANIFWGFCSRPGIWRRGAGAHVHPAADEVLVYLGLDPNNSDCLGAEIEVDLGKEHERHLIDTPVAIVCPAGTPHMPQVTRWVDRPFAFFAVCLSGEHDTVAFD